MSTPASDPSSGRVAGMGARAQLFVAAVLFGLLAVTARVASGGEGGFTAGQTSLVRFAVGVLASGALFAVRPGTFRPVNHRLLVTRGLLGGLAVVCYFVALARIPAGEATLLNNTFPVWATIVSIFTLRERPTVHLAVSLAITTVGVALVLGGGTGQLGLGWGELAGIVSAVLGGGAVASIRALRPTDNAPTIFFAFCVGGLVVSAPFAVHGWPMDGRLWAAAIATGVLAVGAQLLMTQAMGFFTVPEAAVWQQLNPVMSYVWAMLFLGESVGLLSGFGVFLVLAGVAWGVIRGHRARAGEPHEALHERPPVAQ